MEVTLSEAKVTPCLKALSSASFRSGDTNVPIVRLGVALPSGMLDELDQVVTAVAYPSRSKAIQDAVESLIVKTRWLSEQKGEKTGVLILVYDHDFRGLEEYLTDTEHQYSSIICSTTHVHLTKRECLEVMVVKGEGPKIRELANRLRIRKGVKQAELAVVAS
jgi:CopG family nickel-responsive transcriptional regulator